MMQVTSTETIERPDVRDQESNSSDEVFHYVKKNRIAESAVLGSMVQALCGEIFPVTKTPKPGSPICEPCKEIYAQLRKE